MSASDVLGALREEIRQEVMQEVKANILAALGEGKPAKAAVKTPGKKRGRPAAVKGDAPHGKVFDGPGRGRKQCPNCQKYVPARSEDCTNCFFNFAQGRVLPHKDAEGQEIAAPAMKKTTKAKKAAPAEASVGDDAVEKLVTKLLKKAGDAGISTVDLMQGVVTALKTEPNKGLTKQITAAVKKLGQLTEQKTWKTKAA